MTVVPTVIKVGGSLLRGATDYGDLAALLERELRSGPVAIVVSAAAGVTDALASLPRAASTAALEALLKRHEELAGKPVPPWLEAELRRGAHETGGARTPSHIAWGEQASAWALQCRLQELGVAAPVVELYARRPRPFALPAIVPGFYLRDRHGRARALPRGGSDITAVLVALRIGARTVRYWKEGGGIRSGRADGAPMGVVDAPTALARLGRTIRPLHPAAVRIADRRGIELVLEPPGGGSSSTRIVPVARLPSPVVVATSALGGPS